MVLACCCPGAVLPSPHVSRPWVGNIGDTNKCKILQDDTLKIMLNPNTAQLVKRPVVCSIINFIMVR